MSVVIHGHHVVLLLRVWRHEGRGSGWEGREMNDLTVLMGQVFLNDHCLLGEPGPNQSKVYA